MELNHLEADQEGMLRGGFSFLKEEECGDHPGAINGNCDCNTDGKGCIGNANCDCNTRHCDLHNCNCNCNCKTTPPPVEEKTKTAEGNCKSLDGMGLFMF